MRFMRRYRTGAESFAKPRIRVQAGRTFDAPLLRSRPRARAAREHPRAPVPARADLAQRGPAADGQAARAGPSWSSSGTSAAINSLRTLPYLKAWHERYAEAGLRVIGVHTGGVPAVARRRTSVRARRRAPGDRVSGGDRHRAGGLGLLRQRGLARAATCGTPAGALFSLHYGEGAYAETELEIQELLGVEREPLAPVRPEDEPGLLLPRADRGPARRLLRPLRGGRRVGGARGRGELTVDGARDRDRRARLPPAGRARAPHRGRARAGRRRRARRAT